MITPQTSAKKLAEDLGLKYGLYLKREDKHPLGSHKGRSLPHMIDNYKAQGRKKFVISSSGNAALAAGIYIREYNDAHARGKLSLEIYVGKNIEPDKLKILQTELKNEERIEIKKTGNPRQSAFLSDKEGKAKLLRQSSDDAALWGYEQLANELAEIPKLAAVFIPTSSGTTAQGLFEGFRKLGLNPEIHIIQTTACHPFVESNLPVGAVSLAGAIVDKIALRKARVDEVVKASGGEGWVATEEEIENAMTLVKETEGLKISPNSALSIVGLKQARTQGRKFSGPVACLITGR